jgi:hypothetical protein
VAVLLAMVVPMADDPQSIVTGGVRGYLQLDKTSRNFHRDYNQFRYLLGPFGSGKSVTCVMELVRLAANQRVGPDGVRRSRAGVFRATYPELETTTIKTFQDWVACDVVHSSPIRTTCNWTRTDDGTPIELEVYFVALESEADLRKLDSFEFSFAWINEARELPWKILDRIRDRCGRFPNKVNGGLSRACIIADTNHPETGHWLHQFAVVEKPSNMSIYRQPGALRRVRHRDGGWSYSPNPDASGYAVIQNAGYSYWMQMLEGKGEDDIKVNVLSEWGSTFSGKAVYDGLWDEALCVPKEPIKVLKGLPLYLGWDFGNTPACVVAQITPLGQVRVLREFTCDDGDLVTFLNMVVMPALACEPFQGLTVAQSWEDPSGRTRSQINSDTCHDELRRRGLKPKPGRTNDFAPRRGAVVRLLRTLVDGRPACQVDRSCTMLIKGFNGGYQYSSIFGSHGEVVKDRPDKNEYSHVHDALQYLADNTTTPDFQRTEEKRLYAPPRVVQTWRGADR